MKKIFNNIIILFSATLFLVACNDDEITTLNSDANTVVNLDNSSVVLDPINEGSTALNVSWDEPNFGYDAGADYQIIFTYGVNSSSISNGIELSKAFETVELNKILLGLELEAGIPTEVQVQVRTVLSAYKDITSETTSFTAVIYEDKLDLSTIWGVVGSAAPNSWDGPDVPFYTTSDPTIIVAYPTLTDGEIKFRTNNSWDLNYGDTGLDGTLDKDGDNIPVDAGMYRILLNTASLTYTMEEFTWGLVGSATENGWDGPDMPLEYDSFTDTWKGIVTLAEGEWKFRQNNDWGVNYGDTGLDGNLEAGGDNIPVSAGNYIVTFDEKNLVYTIEETDIWGLVGDAAPNGWDGPNAKFTRDWEFDDVWILNGVDLTDGEVKFRTNDSWDYNLGDTGLNGQLEPGGDNIPVTAGKYNITLDLSNPDYLTYTIQ